METHCTYTIHRTCHIHITPLCHTTPTHHITNAPGPFAKQRSYRAKNHSVSVGVMRKGSKQQTMSGCVNFNNIEQGKKNQSSLHVHSTSSVRNLCVTSQSLIGAVRPLLNANKPSHIPCFVVVFVVFVLLLIVCVVDAV